MKKLVRRIFCPVDATKPQRTSKTAPQGETGGAETSKTQSDKIAEAKAALVRVGFSEPFADWISTHARMEIGLFRSSVEQPGWPNEEDK